jgi:hypothetical protein
LEHGDNLGVSVRTVLVTLKGFANCQTLSGLIVRIENVIPRFSLRSNLGLKLANAFGVEIPRVSSAAKIDL